MMMWELTNQHIEPLESLFYFLVSFRFVIWTIESGSHLVSTVFPCSFDYYSLLRAISVL